MNRFAKLIRGDWELFPMKRFAKVLLVGYISLFIGIMLVFVGPRFIAARLVTPLWAFSIFVVLGSFFYAGVFSVSMLRRWLRAFRNKSHPPKTI
jgi:hypothetical protein